MLRSTVLEVARRACLISCCQTSHLTKVPAYFCMERNFSMSQPSRKYHRKSFAKPALPSLRTRVGSVNIYNGISVKDLAAALGKDVDHVFECLFDIPTTKNVSSENSKLTRQVAEQVCKKSGVKTKIIAEPKIEKEIAVDKDVYRRPDPDPSVCKPRPPVVTIMGHVDHGKTTLLDHLRKSNVVDQEFGGITQHIGAFSVKMKNGKSITFLDTPGHAAFTAMRGRGAQMTDIVILVVAADDGVMPQTIESINHAVQSRVPIIVAINKCDRPEAEPDICIEDLSQHGVVLEEIGGDVIGVKISALKGTNVEALQDAIIALGDLLEIKSDDTGLVEGRIIESKTEIGRGKVATMLVQRGTLKPGCCLVAHTAFGKVRVIYDEHQKTLKQGSPGSAVETIGWKELPSPGEEVLEVKSESEMRTITNYRKAKEQKGKLEEDWETIKQARESQQQTQMKRMEMRRESGRRRYNKHINKVWQEHLDATREEVVEAPQFSLVVKADVDGSLEAIQSSLSTYDCPLVDMDIMATGVGVVTEADIQLAHAFNGAVYAFNTKVSNAVSKMATDLEVEIKSHNVIYRLFDDVKEELNSRVQTRIDHHTIGEAVIQKVFIVTEKVDGKSLKVPVAGCRCTSGILNRDKLFKIVRGTEVIHTGVLFSLKHFKTEVDDIKENMECGLALGDHTVDIEPNDLVLCFEELEVKPDIEWDLPF